MVEVLFAEGEAGSMKAAKSTILCGTTDGPTSVWMAGKKTPSERENAGWIEGSTEEVVCLGFMLDIGDIREKIDSQYRKDLIYSMYAQEQWGKEEQVEEELRATADCYIREMGRLKAYLAAGETLRAWYSDAPYSLCGFYHLCHFLHGHGNKIHAVKLPKYRRYKDILISHGNWGEVAADEFAAFLQYEKELSQEELRNYALLWGELVKDNSPLRAVVNGRVMGVQEDFYDFIILKRITEKPVREARLIGDILGQNQIGVSDWWYAKRIDRLIEKGNIKVLEDSESKYARWICLA